MTRHRHNAPDRRNGTMPAASRACGRSMGSALR